MGIRFVGTRDVDGRPTEYVGWAPARDLTDEECAEIGEAKVASLLATNLYEQDAPVAARATTTRTAASAGGEG